MSKNKVWLQGTVTTLLLAGVFGLSACSTSPSPATQDQPEKLASSITELFEQALQNPNLSDFERDVFERAVKSGSIQQSDYDEAFNQYEQCVSDLGYKDTWTKQPNGVYKITPPPLNGDDAIAQYMNQTGECADGTTMRIEALFIQQQSNPSLNADPRVTAIQCLLKGGFVEASYTPEDLDKDVESKFEKAPYDVSESGPNECLFNAGYAVAIK